MSKRSAGNDASRFLQAVKHTGARAVTFAERTLVESDQQLPDRLIEFQQAKELPIPQSRYCPAFDYLHRTFRFRFAQSHQLHMI